MRRLRRWWRGRGGFWSRGEVGIGIGGSRRRRWFVVVGSQIVVLAGGFRYIFIRHSNTRLFCHDMS